MELMGRYMAEIGLTPASRSRIAAYADAEVVEDKVDKVEFVIVYQDETGKRVEEPMQGRTWATPDRRLTQEGPARSSDRDGER